MNKKGAGIGAAIGAMIGLMIGLNTPKGLDLLPALSAAPDIESKVNIFILILILAALGGFIGAVGEQLAKRVSNLF